MNRLSRCVLWTCLFMALSSVSLRGQATRVWEGTLPLPTYALGEEDPNPPFLFSSWPHIYPYTRLLDLTQRREVQNYRAFFLENDYLKATILPGMDGRIYSLYDKVSGREVFYRNNVVKYSPLALRGAWISGGVELNFPDGHTVTTVSPVYSLTRQNPDGSASVVVGNVDQVTGMYWQASLTLHPDEARLEQGVTLFNATPTTNIYWYWANASVRATDDLQFVIPAREMSRVSRQRGQSYPVYDGTDYSWYKNVTHSYELFGRDVHRDFFGAYYHTSDYGVAHVADFREVPGKKYFSWGVADSGLVWTRLLTDDDGPYAEIQSGRYQTQLNYDFMPPRRAESWTEYWYPVRGLEGGFAEATRDVALNVIFVPASKNEPQHAVVALCPVAPLRDLRVRVKIGPQTLRELGPVSLKPLQPQRFSIAVADLETARKELAVEVESAEGTHILHWSAADPIDGNPDFVPTSGLPEPPPKPPSHMTTQELFLYGEELEKAHDSLGGARIYKMVLERDPSYIPALLKQAWRQYGASDFPAAESLLQQALARTDSDPTVWYASGVINRGAEHWSAAEDGFWAAIHFGGPPGPAYAQLGEMALRQQRYERAVALLECALRRNPGDALARADLAAALRLEGKTEDAAREISVDLKHTELFPFSLAEAWRLKSLQGGPGAAETWKRWQQHLTADAQNYLEVAAWYRAIGDLDSSNAVLEAALRTLPPRSVSPLVYYYLASNARRQGRMAAADQFAAQGAAAPYVYVFPRRLEDAAVLKEVCQKYPADSHAPYYLGNFLFFRGHYDEAAALWQQALGVGFHYSVLRRNLGLYDWRVKNDLPAAAGQYEQAIRLAPNDYTLYLDLDQIYFQLGDLEARRRRFAGAPLQVLSRDTLRVRRALLLIQQRQYDDAIAALMNHRFSPGEHELIVRQVFVRANLEKGQEKLKAGDAASAEAAFRRALEYPSNFNIGKRDKPNDQEALYWLGEALQAEHKPEEARAAWQEAVGDMTPATGSARVFQALALDCLGRSAEATKILTGLVQAPAAETASAQDFYLAGLAHRYQDQKKEGCGSLRRALELDPFLWQARLDLVPCGD